MVNTIVNYLMKNKMYNVRLFNSNILNADFVILATALSQKQINEVAHKMLKFVKCKYNLNALSLCGSNTGWVVLDLNVMIVHIMLADVHELYKLDDLYK